MDFGKKMGRNALVRLGAHLSGPREGRRIVAFHEIRDGGLFRKRMEWLRAAFEVVPLHELIHRPPDADAAVALTFDDGYGVFHELVAPVLADLGLPATFFVCSGFVGLTGSAAAAYARRCLQRVDAPRPLTHAELADLACTPGFEIGSHTVHHLDVGRRWDRAVLRAEIDGDRDRLADWTGRAVRLFAYPFGERGTVSEQVSAHVRASGFDAAVTCVPGFVTAGGDPFLTPRDGLDETDPLALWRAWLQGGYDRLYAWTSRLALAG